MEELNKEFWDARWKNQQTGWDIGHASPAIVKYFEQVLDKDIKILIPGCGNAHEAFALSEMGFQNITLLDIAPTAVEHLKEKFQNHPNINTICDDFFLHENRYDLMVEQTFFCAISPDLREQYIRKASEILEPEGKIIGLLFNTEFEKAGPPFGGDKTEYKILFDKYFEIKTMEDCYNSIEPRKGSEVFINLKNKKTV